MAFRSCVRVLTGVDLSSEMLARAGEKGCYDNLVIGDIACFAGMESCYDLVTACDVFVYLGDLATVFENVHRHLKCDGLFAFSTELLSLEGCGDQRAFHLRKNGRFAHSLPYIESLA